MPEARSLPAGHAKVAFSEVISRDKPSNSNRRGSSMDTQRRISGYAVVVAVLPYLAIKIVWTVGLLLPSEQMGEPSWRAINAATAVLAAAAIVLALAFIRPWGERLPAWAVMTPVWVGTGLLVPMLLLAPVLGPAAIASDSQAGAADIWVYEQVLIMLSLVGVGIGLPVALLGYVRARWPVTFERRIDTSDLDGHLRGLYRVSAGFAAGGAVAFAVAKLYWGLGGTAGLVPTQLGARDLWWYLISLNSGLWALGGTWALRKLAFRAAGDVRAAVAAAWVASGLLFSHSLYDLMLRTDVTRAGPEQPLAQVLSGATGLTAGLLMVMTLLLVLHDRRRAWRPTSSTPEVLAARHESRAWTPQAAP
jgi:hypothetical protein